MILKYVFPRKPSSYLDYTPNCLSPLKIIFDDFKIKFYITLDENA